MQIKAVKKLEKGSPEIPRIREGNRWRDEPKYVIEDIRKVNETNKERSKNTEDSIKLFLYSIGFLAVAWLIEALEFWYFNYVEVHNP